MTQPPPAAGWYPNGTVLRWWDGFRWTEHTQSLPVRTTATQRVSPDPRLLDERSVVFRHKAELIDHHEWTITDRQGVPLGALVPIGAKALERLAGGTVELRDEQDALIHTLTEDVVRFKTVTRIAGLGKITLGWSARTKFTLSTEDDRILGTIECAEKWSKRFLIRDPEDRQIGRIDYEVVPLNRHVIDRYEMWVHLDQPLTQPLAGLVLAATPRVYRDIRRRSMLS
ncbi:DUF2510 domain-containing protein [Nocardia sp. NPDC056000]|uniref:DUF2510 domain-containing protein n=1 Tax=Nocardia sp. NPDC056000 TaxID=3345674 RepID=UPI0035DCAB17